jgi:N-acetyl-1-D-myo-inositol-2-amino-2-deoxy-alpha-D-glucopyranoside deacetylase
MEKRLLAVFAHPDDEAFGTGGTLARYASEGMHVALVCATKGEAGEIADPDLATPETLDRVREAELRCAAHKLGVDEVIFLGFRDSGMAGTPENEDPRAYINIPAAEVISRLVDIIRQIRPNVVVTFEPNGGYGHPDHIAVHQHTVAAFHAAGDPHQYPNQGPAWQPKRLYYTAIPRSFFYEMRERLDGMGVDTSDFARFEEAGAGWPDDQIHVTLDITHHIEAKWAALSCHRTQFGPGNLFRRLPESEVKQMMSHEHFAQAWPQPEPGTQRTSLFAGL